MAHLDRVPHDTTGHTRQFLDFPCNRPYSYAAAFFSLTLSELGGAMRRVVYLLMRF